MGEGEDDAVTRRLDRLEAQNRALKACLLVGLVAVVASAGAPALAGKKKKKAKAPESLQVKELVILGDDGQERVRVDADGISVNDGDASMVMIAPDAVSLRAKSVSGAQWVSQVELAHKTGDGAGAGNTVTLSDRHGSGVVSLSVPFKYTYGGPSLSIDKPGAVNGEGAGPGVLLGFESDDGKLVPVLKGVSKSD